MTTAPTTPKPHAGLLLVFLLILTAGLALTAGCGGNPPPTVTVYCALDREYAEPILQRFERETGIVVRAKYDTESTKSVGLAQQLLRERGRPRCDVFWNNEILHTIRLADENMWQPYRSLVGEEYPAAFRSPAFLWYGFAARARVLLVNTQQVQPDAIPATWEDLLSPRWQGQLGLGRPFVGTTGTHTAALFTTLGPAAAEAFWRRLLHQQVQILGGNRQVAAAVAAGQIPFGWTDTDDSLLELRGGNPVQAVFWKPCPTPARSYSFPIPFPWCATARIPPWGNN